MHADYYGQLRYPGPEAMYEYDLFAVINHEGQINNGHYTNYARFNDEVKLDEPVQCVILADILYLFGSGTALTTTSKSNFCSFL